MLSLAEGSTAATANHGSPENAIYDSPASMNHEALTKLMKQVRTREGVI